MQEWIDDGQLRRNILRVKRNCIYIIIYVSSGVDATSATSQVILQPTVSRLVRLGAGPLFGAHDQIFINVGHFQA
jgi:hypothetical protein